MARDMRFAYPALFGKDKVYETNDYRCGDRRPGG